MQRKCRLRWSGLALFAIFEKLHVSADQLYFQEVNSKKSANFDLSTHRTRIKVYIYLQYIYSINIYICIYILQSSAQPTEQTQQVSLCIWFNTLLSRLYEIRTLRVIQTQKAMQQYGLINRSEYSNPYLFSLATGLGTAFFCVLNASFFGVLWRSFKECNVLSHYFLRVFCDL